MNSEINRMKIFAIFLLLLLSHDLYGQFSFDYKGYVANLQSQWLQTNSNNLSVSGTAQNRFDFSIYYNTTTVNIGLRNIVEYGNNVASNPGYSEFITHDNGYFNLTNKWYDKNSAVFYSVIDRLNLFYTSDYFEFQFGRQRINWGVNLVWTPNDIFNSTSYLNFDYEEKSGSDALRGQYYFENNSSLEFVYKIDWQNRITSSLMYRFNKWNFDFQAFTGIMQDDYVFGAGWSGNLFSSNISGEVTYFRDINNFADTTGQVVASLGWTYTFAIDFYLHTEVLFNSAGTTDNAGGANNLFLNGYNAKNLSPAKYSIFGEIAYQVNPLSRIDLSAILNPTDKSFYIGPFATFSVSQSFDLLAGGQFFFGDTGTEWGDYGQFYFLRVKWSF